MQQIGLMNSANNLGFINSPSKISSEFQTDNLGIVTQTITLHHHDNESLRDPLTQSRKLINMNEEFY